MRKILAIAFKDLKLLVRDRAGLFWVLVWPLISGLFFGSLMGGMGDRPRGGIAVAGIDEDTTAESRAFFTRLDSTSVLRIEPLDLETARNQVRRGELAGYVRVLPGFGSASSFRSTEPASIEIGVDPRRAVEKGILEGMIQQAYFAGMQDLMSNSQQMERNTEQWSAQMDSISDMPPEQKTALKQFFSSLGGLSKQMDDSAMSSRNPMSKGPKVTTSSVEPDVKRPRSAFEISFPAAVLWALVGCTAGFAVSLVQERTEGTLLRLQTAPLTRMGVLAGKGLATFLAGLGVMVAPIAVGRLLGMRIENPLGLVLAALAAATCFTGLSMLISTLGKTPRAVGGAGWAVLLIMTMLGGGMIPLIAMPPWMQTVSNISPVKWGILAFEGAIWRGFSVAEMVPALAVLVGVGVGAAVVGTRVLQKST